MIVDLLWLVTFSNDGDVSGYHGYFDYWVVKLNSSGISNGKNVSAEHIMIMHTPSSRQVMGIYCGW